MKIFRCSVLCFVKLMLLKWKEREHLPRGSLIPPSMFLPRGTLGREAGRSLDPTWIVKQPRMRVLHAFSFRLLSTTHPRVPNSAASQRGLGAAGFPAQKSSSYTSAKCSKCWRDLSFVEHELHLIPDGWQWTSGSCGGLYRSGLAKFKWMRSIRAAWFTALDQSERAPEPKWTSCAFLASQLEPFYFERSF